MRVSDDRYSRDLRRMDLALRMIRLEARTHTIRIWTGLSDDRIRKLYRSYCSEPAADEVTRHRGKSPRQTDFFFRNGETSFHSSQLASIFLSFGLVSTADGCLVTSYRVGSLDAGATLCCAYETYRQLHAPVMISFEHAWFLLLALSRGIEMTMHKCSVCSGVRLQDPLARRRRVCGHCGNDAELGIGAGLYATPVRGLPRLLAS